MRTDSLCLLLDLLCDVYVYVFEQSAVSVAQFRGPSLRGLASVCICFICKSIWLIDQWIALMGFDLCAQSFMSLSVASPVLYALVCNDTKVI